MFIPHDSAGLPGGSIGRSTDFGPCTLDMEPRPPDAMNRALGREVCSSGSAVRARDAKVRTAVFEVRTLDAEVAAVDAEVRSRSFTTRHSYAEFATPKRRLTTVARRFVPPAS